MLAETAVKRVLANPELTRLFTDEERQELGRVFAATNATAQLLGRARIRRRLTQVEKDAEAFSEAEATDFSCFDEDAIYPLSPLRALAWFRRLVPGLFPNSHGFDDQQQRQGFTLAVTTDQTLLKRVKDPIVRALETGRRIRQTPRDILQVLDAAGVSPRNPQYSEMVFRTNMMSAYNYGSHAEMQQPDIAPHFPVWRYAGIRDGRQGKDHEPHFDKYYPNSVSFEEVRGPRVYNCRCTSIPVYKKDWARLQSEGAAVSRFAEHDVRGEASLRAKLAGERAEPFAEPRLLAVPDVPQTDGYSCGAAATMAVGGYFGVGPTDLQQWKLLLGTNEEAGTPPQSIVRVLRSLGLRAEPRQNMSLEDLNRCWQRGSPVICPIQDYGVAVGPDDWDDGHYVTVVGVGLGMVFVQDSMADVELEGANSDAVPGRVMIEAEHFEAVWHDRGADGIEYRQFGIVVSR